MSLLVPYRARVVITTGQVLPEIRERAAPEGGPCLRRRTSPGGEEGGEEGEEETTSPEHRSRAWEAVSPVRGADRGSARVHLLVALWPGWRFSLPDTPEGRGGHCRRGLPRLWSGFQARSEQRPVSSRSVFPWTCVAERARRTPTRPRNKPPPPRACTQRNRPVLCRTSYAGTGRRPARVCTLPRGGPRRPTAPTPNSRTPPSPDGGPRGNLLLLSHPQGPGSSPALPKPPSAEAGGLLRPSLPAAWAARNVTGLWLRTPAR